MAVELWGKIVPVDVLEAEDHINFERVAKCPM
jgi:hypothetical protein